MAPNGEPQTSVHDFLWIVRRLVVWAVFIGLLYWVREFLLLIFLTYVFVYSAGRAVSFLEGRFPRVPRALVVTGVFLGILGVLAGLGFLIVPSVKAEADKFVEQFPKHRETVTSAYRDFVRDHPGAAIVVEEVLAQFSAFRERLGSIRDGLPATAPAGADDTHVPVEGLTVIAHGIYSLVAAVVSAVLTVFLALIFAFLILVDKQTIQREVKGLETSRVGWIYKEVRESIIEVGESVGRILEAQFLISLVETVVIVALLWILGVPSLVLLGVLMFFVGLVPVLGGLLGAIPVAWVAFTAGEAPLLVKSMIAYAAVRLVAGYTIEPKIFGSRFHINTVFILGILLLGYKAAGIWGVLLGLPIAYAIIRPRGPRSDALLT